MTYDHVNEVNEKKVEEANKRKIQVLKVLLDSNFKTKTAYWL